MEKFDITSYLDGEMSGDEKIAFEAEMNKDPDFAEEVDFMKHLSSDLNMELLREQVTGALAEDGNGGQDGNKSNKTKWLGGLLGIAFLAVALFFFIGDDKKEMEPPVVEEKVVWPNAPKTNIEEKENTKKEEAIPENKKEQKTTPPQKKEKPSRIIAENKPAPNLMPPSYPAPNLQNVRGSENKNVELKNTLDQIWYMDFPPEGTAFNAPFDKAGKLLAERDFTKAYVRLNLLERKHPENDTLNFMKGYCLLELGQGEEALSYLEKNNTESKNWKEYIEWYKAISHLSNSNDEEGIIILKKISGAPSHYFNSKSKKAIELIE